MPRVTETRNVPAYTGEVVPDPTAPMISGQSRQTKAIIVRDSQGHSHEVVINGSTTRDKALVVAGRYAEYFFTKFSTSSDIFERVERTTTSVTEEKID